MNEWTLIMTLLLQNPGSFRASITDAALEHVSGFTTREACIAAGTSWRRDLERLKGDDANLRISAVCVASSLPQVEQSTPPPR